MIRWFEENGLQSDVVVSSRVRLARNLRNYNFSPKLADVDARVMVNHLKEKIATLDCVAGFNQYDFSELDDCQKHAMKERHVISNYLLGQNTAAGFVSSDEDISIMFNEEDHIRIQGFDAGMNIKSVYDKVNKIDDSLGDVLDYAYDKKYGYLTTCPSSVGTGMRVTYMLHLPALTMTNRISGIATEVGRFGMMLRSVFWDNNSDGYGDIYKLTNQLTLGLTEQEAMDNLNHIANQIILQERAIRKQYIASKKIEVLDSVYRSYGLLKYARKLSQKDGMILLSQIRMGLAEKLIHMETEEEFSIYQLMIGIQPANLMLISEEELSFEALEERRAQFIREHLPLIQ